MSIIKKVKIPSHLMGFKETFYETKIYVFGILVYHSY